MADVLVIVDMLNDFIEEDGALYIGPEAERVKINVEGKLKEYREKGKPVIHIADNHLPNDSEFNMFPSHCLVDDRGSEVINELAPNRGEYLIPKRRYSAFFGTELDLTLRELGVKDIELVGVCTNICVLYTSADARMLHYGVTVDKECVASFDIEAHSFALREMEKTLGVKVV
jgi:nicotinamidase-related amidase